MTISFIRPPKRSKKAVTTAQCQFCQVVLSSQSQLELHFKEHVTDLEENGETCLKCQKEFTSLSILKDHILKTSCYNSGQKKHVVVSEQQQSHASKLSKCEVKKSANV